MGEAGLTIGGLSAPFIPATAMEWLWGKAGYDIWANTGIDHAQAVAICRPGKMGAASYGFYITPPGHERPVSLWWALVNDLIDVADAVSAARTYFAHCAGGLPRDMVAKLGYYDTRAGYKARHALAASAAKAVSGKVGSDRAEASRRKAERMVEAKAKRARRYWSEEAKAILRREWPTVTPFAEVAGMLKALGEAREYTRDQIYAQATMMGLRRPISEIRKRPRKGAVKRAWSKAACDILVRDWPRGVTIAEVEQRLEALGEGLRFTRNQIYAQVIVLGLRRPAGSCGARKGRNGAVSHSGVAA